MSSVVVFGLAALLCFYALVMFLFAANHSQSQLQLQLQATSPPPFVVRKERRAETNTNANTNANANPIDAGVLRADKNPRESKSNTKRNSNKHHILTAYLEPIDESQWIQTPLPKRTSTAKDLTKKTFPKVNSCSNLLEQLPTDKFPDKDPFLPWIHDVFPTHDGTFVQIVAQNRRRCNTGKSSKDREIHRKRNPQVALFQTVAVKRVKLSDSDSDPDDSSNANANANTHANTRYRLAPYEEADEDGNATRFICRFSNGEETLSVFNFNYEWASYRKKQTYVFHERESDNKQIHTSTILFRCPVPKSLINSVRTGESVVDDFATLFLDLVPIRTPPRFGRPNDFLPLYYKGFQSDTPFDAATEWGTDHVLPKIEDSGRWQNIPICKPSLLTYGNHKQDGTNTDTDVDADADTDADSTALITAADSTAPIKQHRLVSCLWASAGYSTRGERFAINDGQRRLLEWITYNKITGVEHFYVYDNSEAHSTDVSLKFIADMFPNDVTIINWPAKICNNNPNNVDSPGERSSQYAAEASCRLRFGPHTDWIAQFDIDEYLVPMGDHTSLHPMLDKLDEEGTKIISFGSWRAWPRRLFVEDPNLTRMRGRENCGYGHGDCFQLTVPQNYTMLQAYNCDRQKPGQKKEKMPAEKQIYRADYVLHHFIHYSTVTELSNSNKEDYEKSGLSFKTKSAFPDPKSRFGNENNEALMLHTKAVAHQDTLNFDTTCKAEYDGRSFCRLGNPFPDDNKNVDVSKGDENGLKFNCYVNHKIDNYWVKELESKLKEHVPEIAERIEAESSTTA